MPAHQRPVNANAWKLTESACDRVLRFVMAGATLEAAARAVGCSKRTLHRQAVRDEEFGWRLGVAMDVRNRLRRIASDRERSGVDFRWAAAQLFLETLERAWGEGEDAGGDGTDPRPASPNWGGDSSYSVKAAIR